MNLDALSLQWHLFSYNLTDSLCKMLTEHECFLLVLDHRAAGLMDDVLTLTGPNFLMLGHLRNADESLIIHPWLHLHKPEAHQMSLMLSRAPSEARYAPWPNMQIKNTLQTAFEQHQLSSLWLNTETDCQCDLIYFRNQGCCTICN